MQIYADVTACVMRVAGSSQTCRLGSAIAAAVLAGAHPDFATVKAAMTALKPEWFGPSAEHRAVYDQLYALYRELHENFGGLGKSADLSQIMKSSFASNTHSARKTRQCSLTGGMPIAGLAVQATAGFVVVTGLTAP